MKKSAKRPDPEMTDDENPEWTGEMFARARRGREVLPEILPQATAEALLKRKPGQRGPGKKPAKEPVRLRLDPRVLEHFKAQGPGWQTRINDALVAVIEGK